MLKLRLFFSHLTIILLLWGVGAAALLFMRDSAARLDEHAWVDSQSSAAGINPTTEKRAMKLPDFNGPHVRNVAFIASLMAFGTLVAALNFSQLIRHVVNPVSALLDSIYQIRKGNFELVNPTADPRSEFCEVVRAFNEMAAELNTRRAESHDCLMRANLINRAILHAIPSPLLVLNDASEIVQANPAARQLLTRLGSNSRLPRKIQRILDECRENSTHFQPEDPREALRFQINDQEIYYLPRIFRFEPEISSQPGWAVLLHNVSRIRWLDDMKTNLLSTVSHEIKTPLTGIRMVLHLLLEERGTRLNDTHRRMVVSATEDCERLLVTLRTLLDLSRSESGATHLTRVPMCMKSCVCRVVQSAEITAAAAKAIRFEVEAADDFPDVFADPIRLEEVLDNLLSNAVKHSPEGGTIRVRLTQPNDEFLRVSVIDQGPGVPPGSHNRIFERFYRAPGQEADGVGLGLFICREIMKAHEGRIVLRKRTSDVTEFYIDVPVVTPDHPGPLAMANGRREDRSHSHNSAEPDRQGSKERLALVSPAQSRDYETQPDCRGLGN